MTCQWVGNGALAQVKGQITSLTEGINGNRRFHQYLITSSHRLTCLKVTNDCHYLDWSPSKSNGPARHVNAKFEFMLPVRSLSWWRHQMETFSVLLSLCAGNSAVTGEFPSQRPVTQSFDFSLISAWINNWINNRDARELGRHRAHYNVTVVVSSEGRLTQWWRWWWGGGGGWRREGCNDDDRRRRRQQRWF